MDSLRECAAALMRLRLRAANAQRVVHFIHAADGVGDALDPKLLLVVHDGATERDLGVRDRDFDVTRVDAVAMFAQPIAHVFADALVRSLVTLGAAAALRARGIVRARDVTALIVTFARP